MEELSSRIEALVTANRILGKEGVMDALGHVTMRHPFRSDRFFMACSRSPEFVTADDIMEFDLDCNPIDQRGRSMYAERPIHGAIYKSRSDVNAVVHNHAHELLPFSVTKVPLRAMVHVGSAVGLGVPVWDIAVHFGVTDLLVRTMEQGMDLASCLGDGDCVLMRGHGGAVVGISLEQAVLRSIYIAINARLQTTALQMGEVQYLSEGEISKTGEMMDSELAVNRMWEYYSRRAADSR